MHYAKECWKPVPVEKFATRYEISSHGRVRNVETGNILQTSITISTRVGVYRQVRLYNYKVASGCYSVARLVMRAFNTPPQWGETRVGHLDGDPSNCAADNLYWIPSRERYVKSDAHTRHLIDLIVKATRSPKRHKKFALCKKCGRVY